MLAGFVVKARFVGRMPFQLARLAHAGGVYLGRGGRWCAEQKALVFRSRAAAEAAIDDKWRRLRDAGRTSVILRPVPTRFD